MWGIWYVWITQQKKSWSAMNGELFVLWSQCAACDVCKYYTHPVVGVCPLPINTCYRFSELSFLKTCKQLNSSFPRWESSKCVQWSAITAAQLTLLLIAISVIALFFKSQYFSQFNLILMSKEVRSHVEHEYLFIIIHFNEWLGSRRKPQCLIAGDRSSTAH